MASLKQRKNTWYAVWYDNGKNVIRTTGIAVKGPKEKKLAQATADTMEQSAKGNIALSAALDSLRKMADTLGFGNKVPQVRDYLNDYKPYGKHNHLKNYKRAVQLFLDHLDIHAFKRLDQITPSMCKDFLAKMLKRVSYGTVKQYKGVLSPAFNEAMREGFIQTNPFSLISLPKLIPDGTQRATKREPFTLHEMHRILTEFSSPWREIATISFLTGGQRLGDIVCLKWESVDFDRGIIHFATMKTGKQIYAPIVPALESVLNSLWNPNAVYVFPEYAARYIRSSGSLSVEFTSMLKAAGITAPTPQNTREGRRTVSTKSFHSIRHTVVTLSRLNPAFTPDLIRETVGHDSEAVEKGYFTADVEARRGVLDFLAQQIAPATQGSEGNMSTSNDKEN